MNFALPPFSRHVILFRCRLRANSNFSPKLNHPPNGKSIRAVESVIAAVPSESQQEKKKAITLVRHLQANSKSRSGNRGSSNTLGHTTQRRSTMKSPESRSDALKVGAVPTHAEGKENDASTSTTKVVDASNPLRRCGGQHARLPLSLIVKRQDLVQLKQEDPTMKKLRPAALNDGLRRNGIKSSSSTNAMDTICLDAASAPNDETQLTKDVMKVPIDPPGSILGARPLMHYSNGPGTMYSEHCLASTVGGYLYSGGLDHRSFQPIFPPIWGYHPSSMSSSQHHHHTHQMQQQQQQQQQHNSSNSNSSSSSSSNSSMKRRMLPITIVILLSNGRCHIS